MNDSNNRESRSDSGSYGQRNSHRPSNSKERGEGDHTRHKDSERGREDRARDDRNRTDRPRRDSGPRDSYGRGGDRRDDRRDGHSDSRGDSRGDGRRYEPSNRHHRDQYSADRSTGPRIDESVEARDLAPAIRSRLRTLSKDNSENVARHLVMAGLLLEEDPQLAHEHAKAAVKSAGRVDVVREAAAVTAYACEEFAEALREIRAMRRLSGREDLRAIEADCERALGRPEKALEIIREVTFLGLPEDEQVELLLVQAGARVDLGQQEIAIKQLRELKPRDPGSLQRVQEMLASLTGRDAPVSSLASDTAVEDSGDPMFVDLEDDGREFFLR